MNPHVTLYQHEDECYYSNLNYLSKDVLKKKTLTCQGAEVTLQVWLDSTQKHKIKLSYPPLVNCSLNWEFFLFNLLISAS